MEPLKGTAHLNRGGDLRPEVRAVTSANELSEDGQEGSLEGHGLFDGARLRLPAVDGGGVHAQELSEALDAEPEGLARGELHRLDARLRLMYRIAWHQAHFRPLAVAFHFAHPEHFQRFSPVSFLRSFRSPATLLK